MVPVPGGSIKRGKRFTIPATILSMTIIQKEGVIFQRFENERGVGNKRLSNTAVAMLIPVKRETAPCSLFWK